MNGRDGLKFLGLTIPYGTLVQLVVIAVSIVGAWYSMKLQLETVNADVHTFIDKEHARTLSELENTEKLLTDGRERLSRTEERQSDMRERLSRLEQRVFDHWPTGIDQSDERGGRGLNGKAE